MTDGHFNFQVGNGFTGFHYINDHEYSRFYFYYNHIRIDIYINGNTSVIYNGKIIFRNFSNIESNIRGIIIELRGKVDIESCAKRILSVIWDKLVSVIDKPDFTWEMLNEVNFSVSLVKSARKI